RMLVVRAAEEANPVRTMLARPGEALPVLKLQKGRGGAAPAGGIHECALATVALVDDSFDGVGDVAGRGSFRSIRRPRPGRRLRIGRHCPGLAADCEPLFLDLRNQQIETLLEN